MSVSFSPDGKRILTGSRDQTAKLWDAASGRELLTLKGHRGWVFKAAFSRDGQRIVTASGDGTAKIWEAASAEQVVKWQKEGQTGRRGSTPRTSGRRSGTDACVAREEVGRDQPVTGKCIGGAFRRSR